MSLKFFFDRNGRVVLFLLVLGWVSNLAHLYFLIQHWQERPRFTAILFLIYMMGALGVSLFHFIPWYRASDRGFGIEEHFAKCAVPLAYTMVIASGGR